MSYNLYLDGTLMPVTPGKVQVKHKNNNKTVDLINFGEVNIVKKEGLSEISFDLLLPNQKYPFANYPNGYQNAEYFTTCLSSFSRIRAMCSAPCPYPSVLITAIIFA